MSWHFFPHLPEKGAHIIALYKGCENGNFFELTIFEEGKFPPLEKWCYYEDYHASLKRKVLINEDERMDIRNEKKDN